jgi:hypothetical protein
MIDRPSIKQDMKGNCLLKEQAVDVQVETALVG